VHLQPHVIVLVWPRRRLMFENWIVQLILYERFLDVVAAGLPHF
jgi:hypothetical protein